MAKHIPATPRQIDYIVDLAEQKGAENGHHWLLERLGAPLSGRASKYLSKGDASDLIDKLEAAASIQEVSSG